MGERAVSIVITNWNGAAYLDDCLDAALAVRGEIREVLVVDNASTDDSVERIRRRAPRVRLVQMPGNDGPCPARNRGLEEASCAQVLQLDSDVILPADVVERLLPELGGGVAVVQPRAVLASDPSVVHYDGGRMHYVGMMCLDHLLVRPTGTPGPPEDVDAVISMCLLLDRATVLELGGYDPAFFILFEDHDLSYRLRSAGHRLRRVPAVSVLHREGTAGLSFRPGAPAYPARRAFLHARNRTYLVLKNYGWPALIASLPGRLIYGVVYAVFSIGRGAFGSWLRGRLAVLGLLPRAWRLRRAVQARRKVSDRVLLRDDDLTFSPVIARRRLELRLEKAFNVALRGLWRATRWMVP